MLDEFNLAGFMTLPFLLYLLFINVITFAIFSWDKYQSTKGGWRIPEKKLLLLSALGGSPAIGFGAKFIRHKTRKQPFNKYLLAIVMIQVIMLSLVMFQLFKHHML